MKYSYNDSGKLRGLVDCLLTVIDGHDTYTAMLALEVAKAMVTGQVDQLIERTNFHHSNR